jgi:hypothetical protein
MTAPETCTQLLDDLRAVVSEEAHAALHDYHAAEHRVLVILTRIEAVMLPVAVMVIWTLGLLHLPTLMQSVCDSMTLAPNSLSATVRIVSRGSF